MAKKIDYASLYTLRKDGRYQGYYTDDKGRHCVYHRDPEALYHKIQEKLDRKNAPVLFRDIAESWHDAAWDSVRDGTKSSYEAPYQKALDRLGDRLAAEITARDISNHLNFLKTQGLSRSTIRIQRTVYSLIFQAAIIDPRFEKVVTSNPALNAPIPKGLPTPNQRQAPEDEIVKLIQQKAETAYFGTFALFLICTGLRRGEALGIKWGDIDFVNDTISCSRQILTRSGTSQEAPTKTEKGVRIIPLLPPLKRVLRKPENAKPTDYVFYGQDPSKPMPVSTYDRRWMHYCKDMGFVDDAPDQKISKQGKRYIKHNYTPTLTAHTLRHGYATILFEADVDVYTAQKLLGHADVSTTMEIYTHLRNKKKAQSVDKLRQYAQNGL